MFKLIESLCRDPLRFPVKPGTKLTPGHVVSIVEYEGYLVVDVCEGKNTLGLLGNRCVGGNQIDFDTKKFAKVFAQRMIVDVDKFDRTHKIEVGNSLYCNKRGMLSSKKPSDSSLVLAKVITPASEDKKHMQILWL
jgi:hypothetical protein